MDLVFPFVPRGLLCLHSPLLSALSPVLFSPCALHSCVLLNLCFPLSFQLVLSSSTFDHSSRLLSLCFLSSSCSNSRSLSRHIQSGQVYKRRARPPSAHVRGASTHSQGAPVAVGRVQASRGARVQRILHRSSRRAGPAVIADGVVIVVLW